jgi:hypothetical protein
LFVNSIITQAMLKSKLLCYSWLFNLIKEFAIKSAVAGNYPDYIMVVKPFTFAGCYIKGLARSS